MRHASRFTLIVLALIPSAAMAQSSTLYTGFSYLRAYTGTSITPEPLNLFGWELGYATKIIPVFGITFDASGNYGPGTTAAVIGPSGAIIPGTRTTYEQHTFLVGPSITPLRSHGVSVNLHGLVGAALATIPIMGVREPAPPFAVLSTGGTDAAFAAAAGGSLDVRLTDHVGYRVLQPELVLTQFGNNFRRDLRASTGLTFSWGR
jgi:hypothetical protein